MNKKNLILASVLAIIFTSILIIFSPSSKKISPPSPTPSPISTESISPSSDPTADWKTYENNDYGFSIKYPANLTIESTTKEKMVRLLSQENIEFPGGNVTAFWIEDNLSISDYIQNTKIYLSPLNLENTLKQTSLTFNEVNFIKLSYTDAMDNREEYITPIKNNIFIFSGDSQILSTFKFIDLTDDWKTYENEKVDFTFKYPNNYSENSYDPRPNTPGSWQIQIMSPLTEDHGGPQLNSRELKIEIYIESKKVNDSLDAFFEEQAQAEDFDPQWTRSKINIAGIEAIKLNWTGMGSGIGYFLINNNKRITIAKYPQNTSLDSEFNQILSTFKFTP